MNRPEEKFKEFRSLLDRDAYEFYRQNRRRCSVGINEYNLYKKTVNGLFAELSRMIPSVQGGVYITDLGYFCYIVNPKKMIGSGKKIGSIISRLKKRTLFTPYFFPDEPFKEFTMHGAFYRMMHERMKRDEFYKLHFDLCEANREAVRLQNLITKYQFKK